MELLTSTVRPAEAEAEAQIRRAEGEKGARIAQAQAEAERVKLAGSAEAAVTVTKGEAQARVVEVNAKAEAQRTTLEGNAEAGITFTKGEAEAKALALRAEAYRQFNEAAIIQTVLSMLPEIVRAAAEPLANIDTLTVLSNDGASDVVKTVTRTVTEANATVKGLTGIDIPALIDDAMGGRGGSARRANRSPATEGWRWHLRRPGIRRWRHRGPGPGRRVGGAAGASAQDRLIGRRAHRPEPPPRLRYQPRPSMPRLPMPIERSAAAAGPATLTDTAAGPAGPAAPAQASAGITRETTLDEAAVRLASDLRAIPGIERFAATRLADLETGGPRPLRTMWRISREQLDQRYGQLTIGELIDRHGGAPPPA